MTLFLMLWMGLVRGPEGVDVAPVSPATRPVGVAGAALTAEATEQEILDALHQRGLDLAQFEADLKVIVTDGATGDDATQAGRVFYDKAPGGDTRMRVSLLTRDEGKGPRPFRLEYLLVGTDLTDRAYDKQIEVVRKVGRPGEKINLLKLGEGPFPLPIGQEPAEVRKQFEVSRLEPEGGRPRVRLVPKAGTSLAEKFSQIDVWVDTATRFPTKIETVDANKTKIKGTELTNLRVNPGGGIGADAFVLPPVPEGWTHTEEAYRE